MNKIKTRVLVTEKGLEWHRELRDEIGTLPSLQPRAAPKFELSQRSALELGSSKRRKPAKSILEYLPKRCELQGYMVSSKELNRSCDFVRITESLELQKQRLRWHLEQIHRKKWEKTQHNHYH